jgi:hypothetical protein
MLKQIMCNFILDFHFGTIPSIGNKYYYKAFAASLVAHSLALCFHFLFIAHCHINVASCIIACLEGLGHNTTNLLLCSMEFPIKMAFTY